MYGHFLFLEKLLPNVEKIRFYMEKESGIRAACLAAFLDEVFARTTDRLTAEQDDTLSPMSE